MASKGKSMSENTIRVLKAGKNTQTRLRFRKGMPDHTLMNAGSGQFLPGEFAEISGALAFGQSEIEKDPSAVLYIVSGDKILDTVTDREFQNRMGKKRGLIYAAVSSAAVSTIALCISTFILPFTSGVEHGIFTAGATLLYLAFLCIQGTRNTHALFAIGILLILTIFLAPSIRELVTPQNVPGNAPPTTEPRR